MNNDIKRPKVDDEDEGNSSYISRKPNEGTGADSTLAGVFSGRRKRRTGRLGDSVAHDTCRERPLLTKLDKDFPVFNESKSTDGEKLPAVVHTLEWNDRMKAIWDIDFLSQNTTPTSNTSVIYGGGFPGNHIKVIATLFPNIHFICVCEKIYEATLPSNAVQRVKRFDKHEAQIAKKKIIENSESKQELLFINDTWSQGCFIPGAVGETNTMRDLLLQEEWLSTINPKCSSLRFWLTPVTYPRNQKYFSGDLCLPSWGPATIKECRLFTKGGDFIEYDQLRFTRQVTFFNKIARCRKYVSYHPNNPTCTLPVQCEGMDWRFDSSTEITVLIKYLQTFSNMPQDTTTAAKEVEILSVKISSLLTNGEYGLATHPSRPGRKTTTSSNKNSVKLNATSAADRYLASLGI